jgi:hypothetical protein
MRADSDLERDVKDELRCSPDSMPRMSHCQ